MKVLDTILSLIFLPAIITFKKIDAERPIHCGQPTDFIGSYSSLGGELFFYRCSKCGQEFTRKNTHKDFSFIQLWRLIFMPKIGSASVASSVDETKYVNPMIRDNPYYRSGVNDGLRVALSKMGKPKIAYLSKRARK